MFISFDTEFQEVSEHINLHSTELDWVANVANIADGQKGRAESDNARMSKLLTMLVGTLVNVIKGQMRSNIQRWLSPSNVQDDLHRRSLEYMPGSCDWVWDTSQAQTFFASSISTSMIIQGRPGSGKTYLSSFIIQSLMKREEQVVLYFFCQAGDPEKREITCILRTILSQLLLVDQSLYETLDPLYTRSGRTKADSYVEVYDAIFLALSKVKETKLVVVIDALDECQKCEDLVQALFGFQERVQSGMSLIFTSRQMPLAFPFGERLMFEQETSHIPIRQYIEHRVFQMETIPNKALKANVVQQISVAADGLWLYARLMLDEVQKLPSTILIERHLSKIPHGLTQLYTQIFRSKEANFTEAHIRFAQHLFVWIDTTEFMPAWFALDCLPYEMICLVFQCVNFGEPVFDPAALMTELCSPVLEAVRLPLGPAESYIHGELDSAPRYKIEFVHHTAYQYLRACQDLDAAELAVVLRPRRLRELYRGVTAVWYFTECEISKSHLYISPDDIGGLHTCGCYFEMSYGLRSALTLKRLPNDLYGKEQAEAESMLHVLTRFISEDSEQCLRWVEGGIVINYAAGWRHLQDKAEEALEAVLASKHSSKLPAFDIFQATREAFHRDYVYVLQLTGPNCDDREAEPTMPKGFQNRPLALKMLNIGKRWQHLHQYREENYTSFRELAVNF